MKYYADLHKNKLMQFASIWMELEDNYAKLSHLEEEG